MVNIKNILSRAAWTAAQAFLGYLSADGIIDAIGVGVEWKMVLGAALATLLSAAKTFVAEKLNPTVTVPVPAEGEAVVVVAE